jgi:hypothetical protein
MFNEGQPILLLCGESWILEEGNQFNKPIGLVIGIRDPIKSTTMEVHQERLNSVMNMELN